MAMMNDSTVDGCTLACGALLPDAPMEVEEALIPISQIPEVVRGGLPDKTRYVNAEQILRERGQIREGVTLRASIDFNKLRRERRKREAREKERKRKADSVASLQDTATSSTTIQRAATPDTETEKP